VKFARSVFLLAGIYGVVVLTPGFFVSTNSGKESTRLIHMEFYYGFFGVCAGMVDRAGWTTAAALRGRGPSRA
jgi:hypothetical protein